MAWVSSCRATPTSRFGLMSVAKLALPSISVPVGLSRPHNFSCEYQTATWLCRDRRSRRQRIEGRVAGRGIVDQIGAHRRIVDVVAAGGAAESAPARATVIDRKIEGDVSVTTAQIICMAAVMPSRKLCGAAIAAASKTRLIVSPAEVAPVTVTTEPGPPSPLAATSGRCLDCTPRERRSARPARETEGVHSHTKRAEFAMAGAVK